MSPVPAAKSRGPVIVVIDDDSLMRELLRLHLMDAGYRVLVAEDGIAGGYMVLKSKPSAIIVDVDMPHMNGYELVEALKADPTTRDIPVIFLSSREDVDDRSFRLGAQAYLRKPVTADRLREVVALYSPV